MELHKLYPLVCFPFTLLQLILLHRPVPVVWKYPGFWKISHLLEYLCLWNDVHVALARVFLPQDKIKIAAHTFPVRQRTNGCPVTWL